MLVTDKEELFSLLFLILILIVIRHAATGIVSQNNRRH